MDLATAQYGGVKQPGGKCAPRLVAGCSRGALADRLRLRRSCSRGGRQVDIVRPRRAAAALPVYANDGRNWIVGTPGHEYAVRIRNCTGGRMLAVTSVDGVNVITGDTASPAQSGYVLEPWESRRRSPAGARAWRARRRSISPTCGDSYAARTGRPENVGVIGVAVFQEKPQAGRPTRQYKKAAAERRRSRIATRGAGAPAPRAGSRRRRRRRTAAPTRRARDCGQRPASRRRSAESLGKLGTGHGRSEDSPVTMVAFERATHSPGRDARDPVRPPREPGRDGRAAAAVRRSRGSSRILSRRPALRARSAAEAFAASAHSPAGLCHAPALRARRALLSHTARAMPALPDLPRHPRRAGRRGADARLCARATPRRSTRCTRGTRAACIATCCATAATPASPTSCSRTSG